MYDLNERVSYLQGLIEGLSISDETKEGKAIKNIADILEEMAEVISGILESQEEIEDYIDCIDDDLADLEDEVRTEEFVEICCPNCGEVAEINSAVLMEPNAEIICPECGEVFSPEEAGWDAYSSEFEDEIWDDDEDYDDDLDWDDEEENED